MVGTWGLEPQTSTVSIFLSSLLNPLPAFLFRIHKSENHPKITRFWRRIGDRMFVTGISQSHFGSRNFLIRVLARAASPRSPGSPPLHTTCIGMRFFPLKTACLPVFYAEPTFMKRLVKSVINLHKLLISSRSWLVFHAS